MLQYSFNWKQRSLIADVTYWQFCFRFFHGAIKAPQLVEFLDLPVEEGILIERVISGGPGANAGIRGGDRAVLAGLRQILVGGDVLVAIDGQKISNQLDLNLILNRKRPGDTVTATVYRGKRKMDIRVTLGEQ